MIGIVTVQWNSSLLTCKLLGNLKEQLSESTPLVIVDNGSSEEHLSKLKQKLAELFSETESSQKALITLIENQHNSGFARANNAGIDYLSALPITWIWLLNNDCQIPGDTINKLTTQLTDTPAGLLGTRMVNENDELETYGGYVFNKWTSRYKAVTDSASTVVQNDLFYPSGASMLIHQHVIEQCGFLDDSTFLYFEEIDLCLRAKQAGFHVDILPMISINHLGAGSSNNTNLKNLKTYHETWSTLYFYAKHLRPLFPFALIFRTLAKVLMLIFKSRFNEIHPVLSATVDYLNKKNKDLKPVVIKKITHYR